MDLLTVVLVVLLFPVALLIGVVLVTLVATTLASIIVWVVDATLKVIPPKRTP